MKSFKIAILGSDGSGKTTFRKFLRNKFIEQGKTVEEVVMGWKDFQNPVLKVGSIFHLKTKVKKATPERLLKFRERSLIYYIIYYTELLTRYFKIRRINKEIVLMDRYFYEELMSISGFKFKIFNKLTPSPDLCIVLQAPLEEIIKRGHYASKKQFNIFYSKLKKLRRYRKLIFVDSGQPLHKMYHSIEKHLPR
jgi:thymidylate kinase